MEIFTNKTYKSSYIAILGIVSEICPSNSEFLFQKENYVIENCWYSIITNESSNTEQYQGHYPQMTEVLYCRSPLVKRFLGPSCTYRLTLELEECQGYKKGQCCRRKVPLSCGSPCVTRFPSGVITDLSHLSSRLPNLLAPNVLEGYEKVLIKSMRNNSFLPDEEHIVY